MFILTQCGERKRERGRKKFHYKLKVIFPDHLITYNDTLTNIFFEKSISFLKIIYTLVKMTHIFVFFLSAISKRLIIFQKLAFFDKAIIADTLGCFNLLQLLFSSHIFRRNNFNFISLIDK